MKTTILLSGLLALATSAFAQTNTATPSQSQPVAPGQTVQPTNPATVPTSPSGQTPSADPTQTTRPDAVTPGNGANTGSNTAPDGSGTYGTMKPSDPQTTPGAQTQADKTRTGRTGSRSKGQTQKPQAQRPKAMADPE